MYQDVNDENAFPDFEQWHAVNRSIFPKALNNLLDKNIETMGFLFFWKHYEHLLVPKFYKLLEQQFPLVYGADAGFSEAIEQNIRHRIFEFAEYAWKIVSANKKGLQPNDVWQTIYNLALTSKTYDPSYVKKRTLDDISEHSKHLGEDFHKKIIEEEYADNLKHAAWLTHFNKQVIDVLQPDLLQLLPELIDMDVEWWRCYKFLIEEQCYTWRTKNDRINFIIKEGLGAEWLGRPTSELMDEVEKNEIAKEAQENWDDE